VAVEEVEEEEEAAILIHRLQGPPASRDQILALPFPRSPPGPRSRPLQQGAVVAVQGAVVVVVVVQAVQAASSCVTAVRTASSSPCAKTVPTKAGSSTSATAAAATSFCGPMSRVSRGSRGAEAPRCKPHRGSPWGTQTPPGEAESSEGVRGGRRCVTATRPR